MRKNRHISRRLAPLGLALGLGLSVALPSANVFAASPNDPPPKSCTNPQGHPIPCPGPNREAPEAPLAVGLPLSALAVFGVYVLRQRRRGAADDGLDGQTV